MSFPTSLSPWFVVQRMGKNGHMEFYRMPNNDEDKELFTQVKGLAMCFTNLSSAARIATVEVAEIRALASKEDAKEFGR